jgi:phosphoglucomutase
MISITIHPFAAKPPPKDFLIDADSLRREYYARKPDYTDRAQQVAFGTSGHRGSSLRGSFNEMHVLAITQAICDYRSSQGISGPLYMQKTRTCYRSQLSRRPWRCSPQMASRL